MTEFDWDYRTTKQLIEALQARNICARARGARDHTHRIA